MTDRRVSAPCSPGRGSAVGRRAVERVVIAVPLLALATPAFAVELWGTGPLAGATVQVQNDFELRYHHVPDKLDYFEDRNILDYWEQVDRLNLQLTQETLSIGAQVDQVAFFANNYILDGEELQERALNTPDITEFGTRI